MYARLILLVAVIIWGSTFVATKVMLEYVSPATLLGLRMLIGLPVLLVVILTKKVKLNFRPSEHMNLLAGSAVITAHFLIQITGLKYTTATNTGWLISVVPLVLAVLSYFILKEKIGRNVVIGIAVATAGVLLLISKGDFTHIGWLESVGDWLVLASAFTWAIYTIIIRDISMRRDPVAVTFAILVPVGILMTGYLLWTFHWDTVLQLPTSAVLWLLYLGICGTALGHWFWQEGVARIGAAKAGIFLYIEPLASTALGVLYLKEPFGALTACGAALVLAGVYLAERRNR